MFSTTRRVVGLVGLTGSLLASFQIPGMVAKDQSKSISHVTKPFSVSLSTQYGAFSHTDTPLPIISTFTTFTIGNRKSAEKTGEKTTGGSRNTVNLPGKTYDKAGNEITVVVNPGFEIQEDTICPHPLEIADASIKKNEIVTSPFVISTVKAEKGDSLKKIASRYKIDINLLKKINSKEKAPFKAGHKVTIFKGNFKKHTVKKKYPESAL